MIKLLAGHRCSKVVGAMTVVYDDVASGRLTFMWNVDIIGGISHCKCNAIKVGEEYIAVCICIMLCS